MRWLSKIRDFLNGPWMFAIFGMLGAVMIIGDWGAPWNEQRVVRFVILAGACVLQYFNMKDFRAREFKG